MTTPRTNEFATPENQKFVRPVIAFLIVTVPAAIYMIVGRVGLPDKYTFDSKKIEAIAKGLLYFEDPSFQVVGDLYRVIGLAEFTLLAGLVSCGLYGVLAFTVVAINSDTKLNATSFFYLGVMAVCNAVYLTQYSKEFFQMPFILVIALIIGRRKVSPIAIAVTIFFYALFFRTYWALTASTFLFLSIYKNRVGEKWIARIASITVLTLALIPFAGNLIGLDVTTIRANLNAGRLGEDFAVTAISTPFESKNLAVLGLSQIILALELIVPLPLFTSGDLQYFLIGVGIASIWGVFLAKGLRHKNNDPKSQVVVLLVAFLITNSLFEPDFGSLLRHMVVLFPLMLMAAWNRELPHSASTPDQVSTAKELERKA
ncbi:MAG: hypothetical protein RL389_749 [Actinomycetota bacterium]